MTLDITIDELDITALQVGMPAQVRIDAMDGEKYTATITKIGNTGSSNGGNSKNTVQLTVDRAENMLDRMNATATIVLSNASDVLTIPADALVESRNQTIVYTGYDEENDVLLNHVTVKVGNSDGETVEILEGLVSGQTCGSKTRIKIRADTIMENFPLFCPKCGKQSLIRVRNRTIEVIKEPDA